MAKLIWTEPALIDLEEIAEYIALDDPNAANRFVQQVFARVERLENHPHSGRNPPEIKDTSYREVIVAPCRILYRTEKDQILILYVMRGERELRKFLLDERNRKTK